jgi:hypothetical protein
MADGPTHGLSNRTLQLPSRALAEELVSLFEKRIQPFSYVFHMDDFRRVLDETYENPIECPRNWLCLIQLVFALASVYKPGTDSGKFFESGLGLCQDSIEDGDFWIVQAYLLISLYYQLTCKRNAFWVTIGNFTPFCSDDRHCYSVCTGVGTASSLCESGTSFAGTITSSTGLEDIIHSRPVSFCGTRSSVCD